MSLGAQTTSFSTRKAFFEADAATVKSVWKANQLDPSKKLDRDILAVMTDVERAAQLSAPLYWKNGTGSETHPKLGIGLDSVQIRRMIDEDGAADFQNDLVVILSHELAHVAQFRAYSLESLADTSKGRAIETQADILAGMTATWVLLGRQQRDSAAANRAMSAMGTRIISLGAHDYDQSHHPRGEQRGRAFNTGMVAGYQLIDVRRCRQANDQGACQRAKDGAARDREVADLDEDFWAWSNRLAKRIAQYSGS
jgi:hypothetical protein